MNENNLSMIISSCDSFSDLWDGHIKQLERCWGDRQVDQTILLTDKPTEKTYHDITVLAAGAELEWSERLKAALDTIRTEYVLITLDDYYLIKQVDSSRINELVGVLDEKNLDYIRLFKHPKRATRKKISGHKGLHYVDNTLYYCVNMYTSIWRTDFARYCADCKLSAWEFEVALPEMAQRYNAALAVDKKRDFVILDVVRKGRLLHSSARYFRKHPDLYDGDREVNALRYEQRLIIQTIVARNTPMWLHKRIKQILRRFGFEFFTED